jgi:formylglycine-generating enzyme required for sulfatase activity
VTDGAPPYGDFRTIEDEPPLRIPTKRSGALVFTGGASALAPPIAPLHWKFQPWEMHASMAAKPARALVRELAAAAAQGGSFLLGVDGRASAESRLREIGHWLALHGESIYGTTYGPFQNLAWARTTATARAIYVHLFDRPRGTMGLDGFRWKASRVRFVGSTAALRFEQRGDKLEVALPERAPDSLLSVVRIDVEGPVYDPADFETPSTSGGGGASAAKGAAARVPSPPRTERIEFVKIPPGEFLMGSTLAADERPPHRVRITHAFEIGRDEVTQAQWQAVMGANPSAFRGPNRPVEMVSWDDVQQFLTKLNARKDGYRYRLPSEAEWEYAARAGAAGDYAVDLDSAAWHNGNSGGETHEVGAKEPNAWGLYDLHGNVWEWCQDWYDAGYYATSPSIDPAGPPSGTARAVRGGSWFNNVRIARPSCRGRGGSGPDVKGNHVGFRCVREPIAGR